MTLETTALLIGRILFGGYFVYSGLNHFLNVDQMTGYADSMGAPYPKYGVLLSGLAIFAGGLGVIAGAYPSVSLSLIGLFLVVVTPWFHQFWNVSEEQKMQEQTNFTRNVALLGAVLAFYGLNWGVYALNMGLGVV